MPGWAREEVFALSLPGGDSRVLEAQAEPCWESEASWESEPRIFLSAGT